MCSLVPANQESVLLCPEQLNTNTLNYLHETTSTISQKKWIVILQF
jgi:hypothetical protein